MINKKIGILFIIFSILISFSNLIITGAIIKTYVSDFFGIITIIFLIVGIILVRKEKEGNLAKKILESGTIITDPKRLRKIAIKMGYEGRNVKEGYQILDENRKPLTVIPHHNISKGVYKSIMKALESGESSFRKYSYA